LQLSAAGSSEDRRAGLDRGSSVEGGALPWPTMKAAISGGTGASLHGKAAPSEAAPDTVEPTQVLPSVALPGTGGASPRVPKMSRAETARNLQAQSTKMKAAPAVRSASVGRIAVAKRGQAKS
jgi:hypothetical protein